MKRKTTITHGCWAMAALAAFWIGSSLNPPASPRNSTGDGGGRPVLSALVSKGSSAAASPLRGGADLASQISGDLISGRRPAGAADFEALARQSVRDPNPIRRRLAFGRLLEALTPENALEIREQLVASGAGGEEWRDFNYSWGAMAGVEAVNFAVSSKEPDLDAALAGWASANPDGAIAFLDDLPEGMRENRGRFAESVVSGLANRDTNSATDLAIKLAGDGGVQGEKLMGLIAGKALRHSGIEDSAAWSESLPDGPLKAAAMDVIAGEYVKRDPEAAAQWVSGFADQDYAAGVIEEVGDGLAKRDPVAAASWLENLPEGRGQVVGLSSVFGDWEDRDPVAASEYLLSMPESALRDSAISGFSRGYAWQDPQAAIAWAEDIGDPALRESTLTRAGQAFLRRDPESARAWLPNSGLSPEAQRAVLDRER
jgi:hypothetical protein